MKTPRTSLEEIRCIAADCGVEVKVSKAWPKCKLIELIGATEAVNDAIGLIDGWETWIVFRFPQSNRTHASIYPST